MTNLQFGLTQLQAGLFAGVLASFVISSRDDLLKDSQKVYLDDIRHGVRDTPAEDFNVTTFALVINSLWFVSFLITLFGTIMGGIATAWFLKAASPSTEETSAEAYKRWILKKHIWRLKRLVVAIPSALHVSLLFFAIGFGLQTLQDHPILGGIMIALIAGGTVFYLAITLASIIFTAPWLHADFFRTPPSELLYGVWEIIDDLLTLERKNMPRNSPHKDRVLATIFLGMINSPLNPTRVDLAIRELVTRVTDDQWLEHFIIKHKVWEVCFSRLEECAWSPTAFSDTASRVDTIILHLKALLHFWEWYHNYLRDPKHAQEVPDRFPERLERSIEPGEILHRWNSLPEATRPLAFCLRAIIYAHAKMDLPHEEMAELPWEILSQHAMHRTHRWVFAKTVCQSFLPKDDSAIEPPLSISIQNICAICICLSVVDGQYSAPRRARFDFDPLL